VFVAFVARHLAGLSWLSLDIMLGGDHHPRHEHHPYACILVLLVARFFGLPAGVFLT